MTWRSKLLPAALFLLRIALGGIFLYAAWVKLREPWTLFAISIDAYHVLPQWAVLAVARALPWFELLLGLVLLAGFWRRVSTVAAAALLMLFFGLMVRAYVRGEAIDCGCFGPGEAISPITLLRDGALWASAVFLAVVAWRRKKGHTPSQFSDTIPPSERISSIA
jgi:uncharacterized membrane protein YphA (DoxX/SURF4 family)